jgi:D-alanine-D-alanine ligase
MRIGLSYDLKEVIQSEYDSPDDAFEEYDSQETVDMIASTLESEGHSVVKLGGGSDFLRSIQHQDIDFVFNISEGRGSYRSREAQVPAVLEMLDMPYTGSDPQCLAVCLDKSLSKTLVSLAGVSTPKWLTITSEQELRHISLEGFPFPVIIKPVWEGSSKGIRLTSLAQNTDQVKEEVLRTLKHYRQPVMVEEFIDGDEVTVGIIGNNPAHVLGMMRILPRNKTGHFVYSVEVKRDYLNLVGYECPVNLPTALLAELESSSLKVFKSLECRDFSRIDFRISCDGQPYFIEINPLPGLGNYSDLIIMAKMLGWKHEQVISAVLDAALKRYPQCVSV